MSVRQWQEVQEVLWTVNGVYAGRIGLVCRGAPAPAPARTVRPAGPRNVSAWRRGRLKAHLIRPREPRRSRASWTNRRSVDTASLGLRLPSC